MQTKEIVMPKRLVADPDTLTYNYGKFIAEPLLRGVGVTLGNSLRRTLLSSIKGAAITAVKIDGVLHEFSTIPSVSEDVVQIVLNLKEIRLRLMGDGPVILYLDAKDAGEVTAADIQPNSKVEIMNPDQHIATLDKSGELKMELYVDEGCGYLSVEANQNIKRAPGIIPIDAIFSPVKKVNFNIENTMASEQTADLDRLVVEIWTDGSINAKDAIAQASDILIKYFSIFKDFDETYIEEDHRLNEEIEKRKGYLSKPVAELELSVRAANCLAAADIVTIKDLVTKSEPEMLKYRNFGRKSLNEIKAILVDMGLSFGMMLDDDDSIRIGRVKIESADDGNKQFGRGKKADDYDDDDIEDDDEYDDEDEEDDDMDEDIDEDIESEEEEDAS
jgi:DNA-directed RNA polymerase subunit alpha